MELNKYLVEFLGTTFFLYVILATGNALAIGAALALAIFVGGKISGGHFNPAVTVVKYIQNSVNMSDALFYVVAQVLGGVAALQFNNNVLA